jgi:hypothetical protein
MGDDMVKCGISMVYGTFIFGEHLWENTLGSFEYVWIYGNNKMEAIQIWINYDSTSRFSWVFIRGIIPIWS